MTTLHVSAINYTGVCVSTSVCRHRDLGVFSMIRMYGLQEGQKASKLGMMTPTSVSRLPAFRFVTEINMHAIFRLILRGY